MRKYRVVCFLAREHGLNGLKHLIESKEYEPIVVLTHKLNPKSEDKNQNIRADFKEFESITKKYNIPLYSVDDSSVDIFELLQKFTPFDYLVSISWRRIFKQNILKLATIAAVNLHRGKLPMYAGADPIYKALENKDTNIAIDAHIMIEEVDAGEILKTAYHKVNYDNNRSLKENVDRLKKEITPLFGPLLINALNSTVEKK